ncbi:MULTISPECIES: DHA2 family efflux MFS transporter permease subunit [Sphingomonadaceae]|uniref:DHA2 family efflux MFS transporter permease subunit n=1 Tax=Sphingomonadaceae TaxID=41297 RepID=UPI0000DD04FA|nr:MULTISPECIES: DHA2 family efflux MFS transporter permease subunit [Sphingomonadaceae]QDK35728.1 MFS transporter [Sphingomonas sp. IC081]QSR20485.1 MFS transporter [Novosphingobium sp. KA1]BAF03296.1 multidrug resistance protein VceB [Novosphingobium sp. KA1]
MAIALSSPAAPAAPLTGTRLLLAALAVGLGNFLVVLDTTIANVSVPTIAGALGVSSSQGTWVITSYAVAEAITVPLTGWLAKRFGTQRVFITCYLSFAVISLLCGLATSMGMLIGGRVLLGLVGGPIMPLSQMLLLRMFPPEKATLATTIWAMTTLVGPVAGPILGGIICDSIGWEWIFFIKVPIAAGGGLAVLYFLRGQADPTARAFIDKVGLALLIVWVAALQIMLDEGRNHDWFASAEIRVLAAVAAVGFVAFLIWELTEKHPIVNLRIFRHRGFVASSITYTVAFGAYFATLVILPLWLQQNMGYTATWAGYATGVVGIFAILSAPMVGKAVETYDPRLIVSLGVLGLGLTTAWRVFFNQDVTFLQMAWPTLITGPFIVMFFVPVTGLAMASVSPDEQADAAGISNFMRTLGGAFATSLVQTQWANAARENQTELAGAMPQGQAVIDGMVSSGATPQAATASLTHLVESQSVMLATLDVFAQVAFVFVIAALLIWFVPKPKGPIDTSGAH